MLINNKYKVEFTENEIIVNGNKCTVEWSFEWCYKCCKRPKYLIKAQGGADGLKRFMEDYYKQNFGMCLLETICRYVCKEKITD